MAALCRSIFVSSPNPSAAPASFGSSLEFPTLSANYQLSSIRISYCLSNPSTTGNLAETQKKEQHDEAAEDYQVVTAVRSSYNDIVILDTAGSRFLLLDATHNVHSLLNKGGGNWTGSYWDEFASLPAVIPEGPIAIYGLGGGTAPRLMLELWPSLQLEGWEIDEILIEKAREFLGLSELEKPTEEGGKLTVCIDDVLSPAEEVSGRYAGIVVDLFSDGKVLSQLKQAQTWLEFSNRLMPDGRVMVNCGGIDAPSDTVGWKTYSDSDSWTLNSTVKALSKAFPGQVSWKRTPDAGGSNFLALTGPLPDLGSWSKMVPICLSENVKKWQLCSRFP